MEAKEATLSLLDRWWNVRQNSTMWNLTCWQEIRRRFFSDPLSWPGRLSSFTSHQSRWPDTLHLLVHPPIPSPHNSVDKSTFIRAFPRLSIFSTTLPRPYKITTQTFDPHPHFDCQVQAPAPSPAHRPWKFLRSTRNMSSRIFEEWKQWNMHEREECENILKYT